MMPQENCEKEKSTTKKNVETTTPKGVSMSSYADCSVADQRPSKTLSIPKITIISPPSDVTNQQQPTNTNTTSTNESNGLISTKIKCDRLEDVKRILNRQILLRKLTNYQSNNPMCSNPSTSSMAQPKNATTTRTTTTTTTTTATPTTITETLQIPSQMSLITYRNSSDTSTSVTPATNSIPSVITTSNINTSSPHIINVRKLHTIHTIPPQPDIKVQYNPALQKPPQSFQQAFLTSIPGGLTTTTTRQSNVALIPQPQQQQQHISSPMITTKTITQPILYQQSINKNSVNSDLTTTQKNLNFGTNIVQRTSLLPAAAAAVYQQPLQIINSKAIIRPIKSSINNPSQSFTIASTNNATASTATLTATKPKIYGIDGFSTLKEPTVKKSSIPKASSIRKTIVKKGKSQIAPPTTKIPTTGAIENSDGDGDAYVMYIKVPDSNTKEKMEASSHQRSQDQDSSKDQPKFHTAGSGKTENIPIVLENKLLKPGEQIDIKGLFAKSNSDGPKKHVICSKRIALAPSSKTAIQKMHTIISNEKLKSAKVDISALAKQVLQRANKGPKLATATATTTVKPNLLLKTSKKPTDEKEKEEKEEEVSIFDKDSTSHQSLVMKKTPEKPIDITAIKSEEIESEISKKSVENSPKIVPVDSSETDETPRPSNFSVKNVENNKNIMSTAAAASTTQDFCSEENRETITIVNASNNMKSPRIRPPILKASMSPTHNKSMLQNRARLREKLLTFCSMIQKSNASSQSPGKDYPKTVEIIEEYEASDIDDDDDCKITAVDFIASLSMPNCSTTTKSPFSFSSYEAKNNDAVHQIKVKDERAEQQDDDEGENKIKNEMEFEKSMHTEDDDDKELLGGGTTTPTKRTSKKRPIKPVQLLSKTLKSEISEPKSSAADNRMLESDTAIIAREITMAEEREMLKRKIEERYYKAFPIKHSIIDEVNDEVSGNPVSTEVSEINEKKKVEKNRPKNDNTTLQRRHRVAENFLDQTNVSADSCIYSADKHTNNNIDKALTSPKVQNFESETTDTQISKIVVKKELEYIDSGNLKIETTTDETNKQTDDNNSSKQIGTFINKVENDIERSSSVVGIITNSEETTKVAEVSKDPNERSDARNKISPPLSSESFEDESCYDTKIFGKKQDLTMQLEGSRINKSLRPIRVHESQAVSKEKTNVQKNAPLVSTAAPATVRKRIGIRNAPINLIARKKSAQKCPTAKMDAKNEQNISSSLSSENKPLEINVPIAKKDSKEATSPHTESKLDEAPAAAAAAALELEKSPSKLSLTKYKIDEDTPFISNPPDLSDTSSLERFRSEDIRELQSSSIVLSMNLEFSDEKMTKITDADKLEGQGIKILATVPFVNNEMTSTSLSRNEENKQNRICLPAVGAIIDMKAYGLDKTDDEDIILLPPNLINPKNDKRNDEEESAIMKKLEEEKSIENDPLQRPIDALNENEPTRQSLDKASIQKKEPPKQLSSESSVAIAVIAVKHEIEKDSWTQPPSHHQSMNVNDDIVVEPTVQSSFSTAQHSAYNDTIEKDAPPATQFKNEFLIEKNVENAAARRQSSDSIVEKDSDDDFSDRMSPISISFRKRLRRKRPISALLSTSDSESATDRGDNDDEGGTSAPPRCLSRLSISSELFGFPERTIDSTMTTTDDMKQTQTPTPTQTSRQDDEELINPKCLSNLKHNFDILKTTTTTTESQNYNSPFVTHTGGNGNGNRHNSIPLKKRWELSKTINRPTHDETDITDDTSPAADDDDETIKDTKQRKEEVSVKKYKVASSSSIVVGSTKSTTTTTTTTKIDDCRRATMDVKESTTVADSSQSSKTHTNQRLKRSSQHQPASKKVKKEDNIVANMLQTGGKGLKNAAKEKKKPLIKSNAANDDASSERTTEIEIEIDTPPLKDPTMENAQQSASAAAISSNQSNADQTLAFATPALPPVPNQKKRVSLRQSLSAKNAQQERHEKSVEKQFEEEEERPTNVPTSSSKKRVHQQQSNRSNAGGELHNEAQKEIEIKNLSDPEPPLIHSTNDTDTAIKKKRARKTDLSIESAASSNTVLLNNTETPSRKKQKFQKSTDPSEISKIITKNEGEGEESAKIVEIPKPEPKKRGRKSLAPTTATATTTTQEANSMENVDQEFQKSTDPSEISKIITKNEGEGEESAKMVEIPKPEPKKRGRKSLAPTTAATTTTQEANSMENVDQELNSSEEPKSSSGRKRKCDGVGDFNPRLLLIRRRDQLNTDEILTVAENEAGNGPLQCGLCLARTTQSNWNKHIGEHYGIGWVVGKEEELDINSRSKVLARFTTYFKQKGAPLLCRLCSRSYRSPLGLLLHLETCGDTVRITCPSCGNEYSKLSFTIHQRTCEKANQSVSDEKTGDSKENESEITEPVLNNSGRFKRASLMKAETKLKKLTQELCGDNETTKFQPKEFIKRRVTDDQEKNPAFYCTLCAAASNKSFPTEADAIKHVVQNHKNKRQKFSDFENDSSDFDAKIEESEDSEDSSGNTDDDIIGEEESNDNDNQSVGDGGRSNRSNRVKSKRKKKRPEIYEPKRLNGIRQVYTHRSLDVPKIALQKWKTFIRSNFTDKTLYPYAMPIYNDESSEHALDLLNVDLQSINFKFSIRTKPFSVLGKPEEIEWQNLKSFQSSDQKPSEKLIYVGAPIKALAWAPLPDNISEQYLIVSCRKDLFTFSRFKNPKTEDAFLLIYKMSKLGGGYRRDSSSSTTTTLGYDAKIHYILYLPNCGPVHTMAFLPSGGYDSQRNRLGLLAIGTAASNIIIYALPIDPEQFIEEEGTINEQSARFISLKPALELILDAASVDENENNSGKHCIHICWSEFSGHNHIFASYANSFIGIWDIKEREEENEFYDLNCHREYGDDRHRYFTPINYFYFSEKILNAFAVHYDTNGPRWLILQGCTRKCFMYDIRCLSNPVPIKEEILKNIPRDIDWSPIWEAFITGFCDSIPAHGKCLMAFNPVGVNITHSKMDTAMSGVSTLHYNPLQSICCIGLDNGDIIYINMRELNNDQQVLIRGKRNVTAISLLDVKRLDGDELVKTPQAAAAANAETGAKTLNMLEKDYKKKYGLVFTNIMKLTSAERPDYMNNARAPPSHVERFMRINVVRWNLNAMGKRYIAIGYENGFLRLTQFKRDDYFDDY